VATPIIKLRIFDIEYFIIYYLHPKIEIGFFSSKTSLQSGSLIIGFTALEEPPFELIKLFMLF
jgi:hypothetical protein